MQQINPNSLRIGFTQNWELIYSNHNLTSIGLVWRSNLLVRHLLGRYGCFPLNSYFYINNNFVYTAVVVYYRYIQRGRLRQKLARILRQGDAVLASPLVRLYLQRRLVSLHYSGSIYLDRSQTEQYFNNWDLRGWGDLDMLYLFPVLKERHIRMMKYIFKKRLSTLFDSTVIVSLYNVQQFIPTLSPITFGNHYMFHRYKSFLYLNDIVQLSLLSADLNLPCLLGNILSIGIEKHETHRRQRRFIKLIEHIFNRIMTWEVVIRKPIDWRISIYGRLDAQMRRQHIKIQVGYTRYQLLDNLINYALFVSKSKFGTASVRIWIRNLTHWGR